MRHYALRIAAITSLLLLFGVGVGLVVFQAKHGKFLSVQTGSMEPTIHQHGAVAVTRVNSDTLVSGDIITFINPANKTQTITHRVVGRTNELTAQNKPFILTKGDANSAEDTPVSPKAVVGKVRGNVPYAGYLIDFVRKPLGLALLIYIPALVVVGHELRRLIAYYKTQEPYVLPGSRQEPPKRSLVTRPLVLSGLVVGVMALGVAIPTYAEFENSVTMTNNTISSKKKPPQPPHPGPRPICKNTRWGRYCVQCKRDRRGHKHCEYKKVPPPRPHHKHKHRHYGRSHHNHR